MVIFMHDAGRLIACYDFTRSTWFRVGHVLLPRGALPIRSTPHGPSPDDAAPGAAPCSMSRPAMTPGGAVRRTDVGHQGVALRLTQGRAVVAPARFIQARDDPEGCRERDHPHDSSQVSA